MKEHTITIELTPGQYGALAFLAERDGYPSVKDCLLGGALSNLASIDQSEKKMREWFGVIHTAKPEN